MATIKDVASAAGVSIATVSRVINNRDGVSKSTAKKVQRAIDELNYTANEAGRMLKTNQSHHIACILTSMTNTFYTPIISGIQEEASKAGYFVIFAASNFQEDVEKMLVDSFASQSIDGIILFSCIKNEEDAKPYIAHLENLNKRGVPIPIITMGYSFDSEKIDSISINYEIMAFDAVNCLIHQNRSRILFISRPSNSRIARIQLAGYKRALINADLPYDEEYIIATKEAELDGYNAINEFLEKKLPLDAVYCSTDQQGVGAIKCLQEHHIKIPEQVAVFGTEDHFASTIISPSLSSVSIRKKMYGELAVQQLLQRINQGTQSHRVEIMMEYTIFERESSRSDITTEQKFMTW